MAETAAGKAPSTVGDAGSATEAVSSLLLEWQEPYVCSLRNRHAYSALITDALAQHTSQAVAS